MFKVKTVQPSDNKEKVPTNEKGSELETRPMTKKQKEEFERQRQSELRKSGKVATQKKPTNINTTPYGKKSSNLLNMETAKANKLTIASSQNYSSKMSLAHNRPDSHSSKSNLPSNGQKLVNNKYNLPQSSKSNLTKGNTYW